MGTHQNRLDAKGRVSVPAAFRTSLRSGDGEANQLILRLSHQHDCVEGWHKSVFEGLATPLERLDLFSEEQDVLAATIFADAYEVEVDKEGRIILPAAVSSHAKLKDQVVFMGLGRHFQIWEPAAAEAWRKQARELARVKQMTLSGLPPALAGAA